MFAFLKQSTASQSRTIGPFIDDTDFKSTEESLTISNTDIELSKNGAASGTKNSGGGTHRYGGNYSVTWDATDTNTVGELTVNVNESGCLPYTTKFFVLEESIYDALFGASAAGFDSNQRVDVGSVGGTAQTANDNGADINTILSRVIGTIAAGTHTAQTGDNYPIVSSVTHGNSALKTIIDRIEADTIDLQGTAADIVADTNELQSDDVPGLIATAQADLDIITGATGVNLLAATQASIDAIETDTSTTLPATLATIEADTNELQGDDVPGLIAALENISPAEVNAQVDAAIETYHLDHLFAVDYDPASKPGVATALLNELVESDAGVSRFTANTLEEAPTDGSAPTVEEIRAEMDSNSTQFAAIVSDIATAQADLDIITGIDGVNLLSATQSTIDGIDSIIGENGDGLSSIPWNSDWDAEVQSEVSDGLTAYGASTLQQSDILNDATAFSGALINTINNKIGSPLSSVSQDIADAHNDVSTVLVRVPSEVAQKSHLVDGTGDITPPVNKGIWDALGTGATAVSDIPTNPMLDTEDGSSFTSLGGMSLGMKAEVEAEVDDALTAAGVSTLSQADILNDATPLDGSALNALVGGTIQTLDALDTAQDTQHTATQTAVSNLNDLSTADVAGELATYDGPTNTEMLAAFAALNDPSTSDILTALGTTGNIDTQLADIPTVSEFNARTLPTASYFDATTDEVTTDTASRTASKADVSALATSAELADGTVQVGTVQDGAIGAAAVADIFSTTAIAEAYPTDGSNGTVAQCLYLIMQSLHEFSISSTTRTVKKLDGTTTAATFTLDSATAPTSTTRAS